MPGSATKRYALVFAAWLPFFAIWVLYAMSYGRYSLAAALTASLISMGTASVLGIGVWRICRLRPWPLRLDLKFYFLHIVLSVVYSLTWTIVSFSLEAVHRGAIPKLDFWKSAVLPWQLLMGVWLYGLFAGVSYAIQTRDRLQEKETLAARAETLAASARLDAIRARLNPHFLFNALHTLSALAKFEPASAESAIERLGDMLRYTLKEDGRDLAEFSEEFEFTRQYLDFEKLRYQDRLKVDLQIDPEAHRFDLPPFALQTLAENAVHHAISVRPEGGRIWITCQCSDGLLRVSVRDDGPGTANESTPSHQFGLRSLRERLSAAYGASAEVQTKSTPEGFEATFTIPASPDQKTAPSKITP